MQEVLEFSKLVEGMPVWALIACVMLAGFGLAAYAIYAVVSVTKGHR